MTAGAKKGRGQTSRGRNPSAKNAKLQVRSSMFLNNKNDHDQTVVSNKSYETIENNDSYQEFVENILSKKMGED